MNNLKEIRIKKGVTQKEMSVKLKISLRHYRRLENGEANLTVDKANSIANILETDLNTLFGRQTIIM